MYKMITSKIEMIIATLYKVLDIKRGKIFLNLGKIKYI